jgi:hypothetical protein
MAPFPQILHVAGDAHMVPEDIFVSKRADLGRVAGWVVASQAIAAGTTSWGATNRSVVMTSMNLCIRSLPPHNSTPEAQGRGCAQHRGLPPFGQRCGLAVWVAERLAESKEIAFAPGTPTALIRMAYRDFERVLVTPRVANFSSP